MKELLELASYDFLAATISCIGEGIVSLDLDKKIVYMNQVAEELTNCRLSEAKSKEFDQVILLYDPETKKILTDAIAKLCSSITEIQGRFQKIEREFIVIDRKKNKKYISSTFSLVRNFEGVALGYAGVLKDLSKIRLLEAEQSNEKKNFQSIFNFAPEAMMTINEKERITRVNDEFLRQLDKTRDEVIGLAYGDVFECHVMFKEGVACGEGSKCKNCLLKRALRESLTIRKGEIFKNHTMLIRNDQKGQKKWYRTSVAPLVVDHKKHAVVIFADATETVLREEKILKARDFCNNILNQLPSLAWMTDENLTCIYVNAVWTEYTGKKMEELNNQECIPLIHPDDIESYESSRKEAVYLKRRFEKEVRLKRKDGVYRWCLSIETPYYSENGRFSGYIGSFLDITEQKRTREELQRYHQMIDHARDIIILADLDGNIVEANRAAQEAYQYSSSEFLQMNIDDLCEGEGYSKEQLIQMRDKEGLYFGTVHQRKDHSEFFVEVRVQKIDVGEMSVLFSIARDITERKRAEEILQLHQSRYFYLFMNMNDFYAYYKIIYDENHKAKDLILKEMNKAYEDFLGRDRKSMIGMHFSALFPDVMDVFEDTIKRFDGKMVLGQSVTLDEFYSDVYQRWLSISIYAPSHGEVISIISDVTDKKQYELQLISMKETAEAANRAKSEFLANMSHEIRTPLNGMVGMVDLTLLSELNEEQKDNLETAKSCANALLTIINDILDFSKMEAGKLTIENISFEIRSLMEAILKSFRRRVDEKQLSLIFSIDSGIPELLFGDPNRIRQVLDNLLSNAVKFTEKGEINLRIRMVRKQEDSVLIEFSVVDTGIGIEEEDMKRLFQSFIQIEPTFTKQYGGTGLGLVISKRLVELMGGNIQAQSEIGKGSLFSFQILFRIASASSLPKEKKNGISKLKRKLNILLAEDDALNRKVILKMLVDHGHRVDVVTNGSDAVAVYKPGKYQIILMDIQMPEMDGMEATRQIRLREQNQERTPICALTAYALKGDREKFLASGMDGYVAKPIDMHQLFDTIAQIIQEEVVLEEKDRQELIFAPQVEENHVLSDEQAGIVFEQIRKEVEALEQGAKEEKLEMMERLAHEIKSKASQIDRNYIKDIAFKIELAARRGNMDDAVKEVHHLKEEIKLLSEKF